MQKELVWRNIVILTLSLIIFFIITLFVTNYINLHNQEQEALYLSQLVSYEMDSSDASSLPDVVYKLTEGQTRYCIVVADADGVILIDSLSDQMGEGVFSKLTEEEIFRFQDLSIESHVYRLGGYTHCLSRFGDSKVLRVSVATVDNTEYIIVSTFFMAVTLLAVVVVSIIMTTRTSKKIAQSFDTVTYHLKTIAEGEHREISVENVYPEVARAYSEMNSVTNNIVRYIEKINNEKDKLNSVINNIGEGIIIINYQGEIIAANDFAKGFIGNDECIGKIYSEAILNEGFSSIVAEGIANQGHLDYWTDDGKIFYVSFNQYLEKSSGNSLMAIVIFDVTAARLEEKSRAEFIANASHELKTPITSISGFSELLASGLISDSDTILKYANMILNSSIEMKNTIDELLYLSKIDYSSPKSFDSEPVQLDQLVAISAEHHHLNASKKNVEMQLLCNNASVVGNFGLLAHMVSNLIDNAIKYNRNGGQVVVSSGFDHAGCPYLSVKDTGIGMEKHHLERLYERFYRIDDSRSRDTGGTGLGLTIVKKIVDLHHAEIKVESTPGEGTTFTVTFAALE